MGASISHRGNLDKLWYFLVMTWDENSTFTNFEEYDNQKIIVQLQDFLDDRDQTPKLSKLWRTYDPNSEGNVSLETFARMVKQTLKKILPPLAEELLDKVRSFKKGVWQQKNIEQGMDKNMHCNEIETNFSMMLGKASVFIQDALDEEVHTATMILEQLEPGKQFLGMQKYNEYYLEAILLFLYQKWVTLHEKEHSKKELAGGGEQGSGMMKVFSDDEKEYWTMGIKLRNVNAKGIMMMPMCQLGHIIVPYSKTLALNSFAMTSNTVNTGTASVSKMGSQSTSRASSVKSHSPRSSSRSLNASTSRSGRSADKDVKPSSRGQSPGRILSELENAEFRTGTEDFFMLVSCTLISHNKVEEWSTTELVKCCSNYDFQQVVDFQYLHPSVVAQKLPGGLQNLSGGADGRMRRNSVIQSSQQTGTGKAHAATSSLSQLLRTQLQYIRFGVWACKLDDHTKEIEVVGCLGRKECLLAQLVEQSTANGKPVSVVVPIELLDVKYQNKTKIASLELILRKKDDEDDVPGNPDALNDWATRAWHRSKSRVEELTKLQADKSEKRAIREVTARTTGVFNKATESLELLGDYLKHAEEYETQYGEYANLHSYDKEDFTKEPPLLVDTRIKFVKDPTAKVIDYSTEEIATVETGKKGKTEQSALPIPAFLNPAKILEIGKADTDETKEKDKDDDDDDDGDEENGEDRKDGANDDDDESAPSKAAAVRGQPDSCELCPQQ